MRASAVRRPAHSARTPRAGYARPRRSVHVLGWYAGPRSGRQRSRCGQGTGQACGSRRWAPKSRCYRSRRDALCRRCCRRTGCADSLFARSALPLCKRVQTRPGGHARLFTGEADSPGPRSPARQRRSSCFGRSSPIIGKRSSTGAARRCGHAPCRLRPLRSWNTECRRSWTSSSRRSDLDPRRAPRSTRAPPGTGAICRRRA